MEIEESIPVPTEGNKVSSPQPVGISWPLTYDEKFLPSKASLIIKEVLKDELTGKTYVAEEMTELCKTLSDTIKINLCQKLQLNRYKIIVQVVIGESRGQGTKMAARYFWDPSSDNKTQEIYSNDSLFCVASAYGVFFY